MIGLRHIGIYVSNIDIMEDFYEKVFEMKYICKKQECLGDFDRILGKENTVVLMTKLITPKGVIRHEGDMIELLQIVSPIEGDSIIRPKEIFSTGKIHFAFECEMEKTLDNVIRYGGEILVEPVVMSSGNSMSFVADPEKNVIELIERY